MKRILVGGFILLLSFFLVGCKVATVPFPSEGGEIKEFTLTAKQWEFSPNTITVNEGDNVRLLIKSVDVTHGFALLDFAVNEQLQAGQTTTVEFVAHKSGTFPFWCSVKCGRGHGDMRGKLIVN